MDEVEVKEGLLGYLIKNKDSGNMTEHNPAGVMRGQPLIIPINANPIRKKPVYDTRQKEDSEIKENTSSIRGQRAIEYLFVIDQTGRVFATNETAVNEFGSDIQQVIGLKLEELIPECIYKTLKPRVNEVLLSRKPFHFEDEYKGRLLHTTLFPFLEASNQVQKIAVYTIDITKRRKIEDRYRLLVETMNDGLSITDENEVIIYANDKFTNMLGYSKAEMIGHPVTDFLETESQRLFQKQSKYQREKIRKPYGLEFITKDWRKVNVMLSPSPIFDVDGVFKGSFAVITDITELKQAEKMLKNREIELEKKTLNLQDTNAALKILLHERDGDKRELEDQVLQNVKELIMPFMKKLRKTNLDERQRRYLDVLESNVRQIISPFSRLLSSEHSYLTPAELQIANLVKEGKSSKDIGEAFNLSVRTVDTHRRRIRMKLGIANTKKNLRSHLLTLQ